MNQITDTVLMIKPVAYKRNEVTAENNYFQPREDIMDNESSQVQALAEFEGYVDLLKQNDIEVLEFLDIKENETPDSIFPNNWNSFHEDGTVFLYPMFAENRRKERRTDILERIQEKFIINRLVSLTEWEKLGKYLEGTGSLIFDRPNKIAYACLSERTHIEVLQQFSKDSGFKIISFVSNHYVEEKRLPIYHTNVMMCVGENFAIICLDTIDDSSERNIVLEQLRQNNKEIIEISEEQMQQFAGNMLQLRNTEGERFIIMSKTAFHSLDQSQIKRIEKHGRIISPDLHTIETLGGGSARCMLCEIFLPKL